MEEFKCDLCGKTFRNKAGLGGHKAALHGIKRPPQPKLKDLLRDGLGRLQHHLVGLDARVSNLEGARLQQPLGPGTPPIDALAKSLSVYLSCEPSHNLEQARVTKAFKEALGIK